MQILKKISESLKKGLCAVSMSCREASRLQSEALDHELCPSKRVGLRLHLLICRWCRRYGRQVRFLGETAHEHPENLAEATPEKLSPEARERIKQRLQAGK